MTRAELVDYLNDSLTASCALPFSLPKEEIERIIGIESKWLYREYREAQEVRYYIIHKAYYQSPQWKATRTFQLPECVEGLRNVYETNTGGGRVFGIHDPDLSFDRVMASDMYLSPLSTDQIMYRTIQWSMWDLARSFNLKDIQHHFNPNTRRLQILGRDPVNDLFVEAINRIDEQSFYEDPLVIKWMEAKCLISLAKILGTFNYTLLGGVTISFAEWKSVGEAMLTELKEKIAGDNAPDWFISFA